MSVTLVQETATRLPQNLLANSEDLSADWATDGVTVDTDVAADPIIGATTMDRINVTAETNQHRLYNAFAFVGGVTHTFSIYAKDDGGRYYSIGFNAGANDYVAVVCDLQLGTVTLEKEGVSGGTITNTSIEEITTGIYRITLSGSVVGVGAQLRTAVHSGGTPTLGAWQDESFLAVAGEDVIVWGAQFENYSTAGTYTKTTAAIAGGNRVLTRLPQNLLLQSEDFSTSWTVTDAAIDTNAAADPNGDTTMDRINVAATTNIHRVYQQTSSLLGQTHTVSAYFKDDGAEFVGIVWYGTNQQWVTVTANLTTGAITKTDVGAVSGALADSGVENIGGGIYRVWLTGSVNYANCYVMAYVSDSATPTYEAGNGMVSYLGVEGNDVFIWGAQLEARADGPGTYVATTTAAVPGTSIVRASTATYFDHNGIMQTAAICQERTDYDPSDNSLRGLLIEEARTNLCLQSNALTTSPWIDYRMTQTAAQAVGPDGTLSMWETVVTEDWASGAILSQQINIATTTEYVWSVDCKASSTDLVMLQMQDGTDGERVWFNLTTGAAMSSAALNAGWGARGVGSVKDLGNGIYRCSMAVTSGASTTGYARVYIPDADGSVSCDINDSIFWANAQLEAGAAPSSYIPTTTASVTRAADDISVTDLTQIGYSATAGSIFSKWAHIADYGSIKNRIVAISDGTSTYRIELYRNLSTAIKFEVANSGTQTAIVDSDSITYDAGQDVLGAVGWAVNDFAISVDGTAATTDTDPGTIPTVTTMYIGATYDGADKYTNGHIAKLVYYPKRLADADLVTLSGTGTYLPTSVATADSIADALMIRLNDRGYTVGSLDDRMHQYFNAQGYAGSIQDQWRLHLDSLGYATRDLQADMMEWLEDKRPSYLGDLSDVDDLSSLWLEYLTTYEDWLQ